MPEVVHGDDGTYYLFTTHDYIGIRKSTDRTNWWYAGQAVPWWGSQDVWAPDVTNHGSEVTFIILFYSSYSASTSCLDASTVTGFSMPTQNSLEVKTAPFISQLVRLWNQARTPTRVLFSPVKTVTHITLLIPLQSKMPLETGGSCLDHGIKASIYIYPVDKNGNKTGSPVRIAHRSNSAAEGPSIYLHNNKYYLFASWGNCCPPSSGVVGAPHEPYQIIVCRSSTINGNYVDARGVSCLQDGHLKILHGQGQVWGTGGQMVFYDNTSVLVYHWYNSSNNYLPSLGINPLTWNENDWPIIY
ncbi:glycosyl hydrolase [Endogone sp. FLAS-F59071]|nr:glycosyl hydrolase [Endogone sp. FLAS-F59071]|eukprot:RUS15665.1 glycosyl hydrolase [Endogone sp. FLAS-F59071]